jgi:dUTP pyrophosphatase
VSQTLQVQRVGPVEVPLPSYQSAGAAGLDLCAALKEPVVLVPGERRLVPTGIAVAIPAGHEGQVRPRSGLALRHGLGVVNAPGTIDADYRGEIGIVLINHGEGPVTIQPLSRIAQLVIAPVARVDVMAVDRLEPTPRGPGGYGSTGA